MKTIKLSEIKIPYYIARSNPSPEKIESRRKYWRLNHEQQRWIVLDKNNYLLDGYIQYLILK